MASDAEPEAAKAHAAAESLDPERGALVCHGASCLPTQQSCSSRDSAGDEGRLVERGVIPRRRPSQPWQAETSATHATREAAVLSKLTDKQPVPGSGCGQPASAASSTSPALADEPHPRVPVAMLRNSEESHKSTGPWNAPRSVESAVGGGAIATSVRPLLFISTWVSTSPCPCPSPDPDECFTSTQSRSLGASAKS